MNSSDPEVEHSARPNVAVQKVGVLARIATFLFGNDVFISYSRSDAAAYALALACELTKQKLTCYLDQWNAPPGVEIPAVIKTALSRSSMLVLVGTRGATNSVAVGQEVAEFLKTGRPIVPITFEESLPKADWFSSIRGLALTEEIVEALQRGKPSERVITRVVNAEGFTRRDKRLRRVFFLTALGIVLLVLAGVIFSWKFRSDAQKQQKLSSANLLSSKASNLQARQPDLALLLALESYRITNAVDPNLTIAAKSGLFELLFNTRKISSFLHGDKEEKEEDKCVAFSPDGKRIAAGNFKGTISVWDVHSRKLLPLPNQLNETTITSLGFSRDGKLLATGRGDGSITIWDEDSQKWVTEVDGQVIKSPNPDPPNSITALTFSPDAKTLVIGRCGKKDKREESEGGGGCLGAELAFLDLANKKPKLSFLPNQHQSAPTSLTYSPDGRTLVSSSNERVSFWDSSGKALRQVESKCNGDVKNVVFGKDNKVLAAGLRGDSIIVWDVDTDEPLAESLIGHQGSINGVALSPDGVTVASVGDDQNTILWDVSSYGVGHVFLTNTKTDTVAVSPNGKFLATGTDGTLKVWDIPEKKLFMDSLKGHTGIQRSMVFSPDNKLLASPAKDSGIILWDLTTQRQLSPILNGNHGFIWRVAFSPDGKILASANDDGTVSSWDLITYKESILQLNSTTPVYQLAFSPDSKLLAIGSQNGEIVMWDLIKSNPDKLPFLQKEMIMGIAFSPDGKKLAVSHSGEPQNKITLWDVSTRAQLRSSLTVNDDFGGGLTFNNDGSLITWVDTKGIVKLWHVGTEQLFARIPVGDVGIDQNVVSTSDGRLVTYNGNGMIVFWDWNLSSWISRACQVANRNFKADERTEYSLPLLDNDLCKQ
jgi:WD40 repeat protein